MGGPATAEAGIRIRLPESEIRACTQVPGYGLESLRPFHAPAAMERDRSSFQRDTRCTKEDSPGTAHRAKSPPGGWAAAQSLARSSRKGARHLSALPLEVQRAGIGSHPADDRRRRRRPRRRLTRRQERHARRVSSPPAWLSLSWAALVLRRERAHPAFRGRSGRQTRDSGVRGVSRGYPWRA